MPVVPTYNAPEVAPQAEPAQPIRMNVDANMFGGNVGQAIQKLGATGEQSADEMYRVQLAMKGLEQEAAARDALNKWQSAAFDANEQFRQLKGKDAVDAYDGYKQSVYQSMNDAKEGLSPIAQRDFATAANFMGGRLLMAATSHSASQNVKYMGDTYTDQIYNNTKMLPAFVGDGKTTQAMFRSTDAAIDDLSKMNGWSSEQTDKYRNDTYNKIQTGRATVMFNQDPKGTLQKIANPEDPTFQGLDPVQRVKLEALFTRQLKSKAVAQPGSMGASLGQKTSPVATNVAGEASEASEAPEEGGAPGEEAPLSSSGFTTNADEDKQDFLTQITEPVSKAHAAGATVTDQFGIAQDTTAFTTHAQDMAAVASASGPTKQVVAQAVTAKYGMLDRDPANYVYGNNPDIDKFVGQGLEKGDALSMSWGVHLLDNTYDKLGQPMNNRPVLTVADSQNEVSKLTQLGGTQGIARLEQMSKDQGVLWPRIYNDLVTQGNLPVPYRVAMSMDDMQSREQLGRAYSGQTDKEFKLALPAGKKETDVLPTISSTIAKDSLPDGTLGKFTASLVASGASTADVTAYKSVVERLAWQKTLEGSSPTDAAEQAIKAVAGKYTFLDKARIPNDVADIVQNNAQVTLDDLKADKIAIPPYGSDSDTYLRSVKYGGYWKTNQDETGIIRMDGVGRIVRDKQGNPLTVPFHFPAQGSAKPAVMQHEKEDDLLPLMSN